jgi:UDP-N-acetylmuramate dehydrogenase
MSTTNNSLRTLNTFGIEAQANKIITIQSATDIQAQLPLREPLLVLGGGSNMLFTQDWQGIVFKINIKGIEIIDENTQFKTIKIGAGEVWHNFVLWAVAQNLGGVENLSLIPGTIGAAPIQNIGAYGAELKDVFVSLEAVFLKTGEIKTFSKRACKFGYRESVFKQDLKGQCIITSVTLRLRKNPRTFNTNYGDIQRILAQNGNIKTVKTVSDAVIAIRQSKLPDPAVLGNSGSFFKNPEIPRVQYDSLVQQHPTLPAYNVARPDFVKIPAGWLIEQAGWKGKRVGNTGSHAQQALVLVNYGNATGAEVYALALAIIADVQQQFGVSLSPEVNIV